ncbi:MAG: glyceraldehyde-3-phosphate dehydrogenase [Chitinophagales bacterium]|jgi:glyceraldehyde 3-phosphate dehydrogenase|nr:glyceraldehyde-3-phosphate dehydrogenase [Chitinophagales bacterium]
MIQDFNQNFENWKGQKLNALKINQKSIELELTKKTELVFFRRRISDKSLTEILNLHLQFSDILSLPLLVSETAEITEIVSSLSLIPSRIDVGTLLKNFKQGNHSDLKTFILSELKDFVSDEPIEFKSRDVVLYGFGRIGRLMARLICEEPGTQLSLKAIVVRMKKPEEIEKRAYLLKKDSIHGQMKGTVEFDIENGYLVINGQRVKIITETDPEKIDYTQYGIQDALLIENTGIDRTREGLSKHLKSKGVSKVLLTAPGKGDVPNIVYGINHKDFDKNEHHVFSAASCTTNAIVPILKIIEDKFKIESGHIETVHSYTNDQNLVDNMHKASRRGRSAPMNMVLTETGAASAAVKALPQLKGKLTANAVRVPTPNVSLAILALRINQPTSREELNNTVKEFAFKSDLMEQVDYSISPELVSTDVIGNSHAMEFDSNATIVSEDQKSITLYAWYDNEYGYSCQVLRLAKYIANVQRKTYY